MSVFGFGLFWVKRYYLFLMKRIILFVFIVVVIILGVVEMLNFFLNIVCIVLL